MSRATTARILPAAALVVAVVAAGYAAASEQGAPQVITVTRFDDPLPPDGCFPGDCSLREAIILANNVPGRQVIRLPAGDHYLTPRPFDFYEDEGFIGDTDIRDDLVIEGAGRGATVITGYPERVFDVHSGAEVVIGDLAIRDIEAVPNPQLDCGRAVRNGGALTLRRVDIVNVGMRGSGGGICNLEEGILTVEDSLLDGNRAALSGGGAAIYNAGRAVLRRVAVQHNYSDGPNDGGAIYSSGELRIYDSVVRNNWIPAPFGTRRGGGVAASGFTELKNVTVSGNWTKQETWVGETDSRGGGLALWGDAVLTNVTVTANESGTSGGGIFYGGGGALTMVNTIIDGNTGGNCAGEAVTSLGHNIDGDGSCGLAGVGDRSGVDPMLGPLADNGGPTVTHALLAGSPAVDAGDGAACPGWDQRGAPRPADGDGDGEALCDIGAFEAGAAPAPPTPGAPTATPVLLTAGDADCDGDVDAVDALWVLRHTAGLEPGAGCLLAANVDCSLAVDSVDALLILRHAAGLPAEREGCPPPGTRRAPSAACQAGRLSIG
jgi:hypothetical protein